MKKNTYVLLIFTFLLSIFIFSCRKEENLNKDIVGLGGEKWVNGPLDDYIYTNFVKPYNIDVLYRWNPSEVSYSNNLVPAKEEKVIPVMEMIKKAWIEPYTAVVGEEFIKKLAPRQYLLVGSPEYNSSGTITLGTAEAGAKIVLYRVNWFDVKDRNLVQAMLKTIHHEFAHILHQNVMYPKEFEAITAADYTSTWNQVNVADARNAGFISSYSMSGPDDDFVEIASIMLTQGYEPFENIMSSISNPDGVAKIRQKQEIVLNYFRQVWGIDFYELQSKTEAAINALSPPPSAFDSFGFDKNSTSLFTTITTDEAKWSPIFKQTFQDASTKLGTLGNAGRFLEDFNLHFYKNGKAMLRLKYRNPSNLTSFFNADFDFEYTESVTDETITLKFLGTSRELNETAGGNANTILSYVMDLIEYLDGQTFEFKWLNNSAYPTDYILINKKGQSENFIYGLLKPTL